MNMKLPIAATALLVAAASLQAQGPPGGGPPGGMPPPMFGMGPRAGGLMPTIMLVRRQDVQSDLQLTDDQRQSSTPCSKAQGDPRAGALAVVRPTTEARADHRLTVDRPVEETTKDRPPVAVREARHRGAGRVDSVLGVRARVSTSHNE
jgi:hypothetical protein